jgi:transcriptional regulator GlxA family with amidase domain
MKSLSDFAQRSPTVSAGPDLSRFALEKLLDRAAHPGVRKSLAFLRRHFHRQINLNRLAAVAGLSPRGLHKAFMRHVGHPPGELLRMLRIKSVKNLLRTSDRTLSELAIRSGFRNVNSLYVAFKNNTGMSPKKFRLQCRRLRGVSRQNGSHRLTVPLRTGRERVTPAGYATR